MDLFISYARLDEDVVKILTQGIEAAGIRVWRDDELHGGDSWWSVILEKIRGCPVFVFALSDTSLHRSKPCRAELNYAIALRRPIVPVQVGAMATMRAMPLANLHVVEYQPNDATSGFRVLSAIHQASSQKIALPHPMPMPPPIPFEYLLALSRKIDAGELGSAEQMRMIDDLRRALAEEQEEPVRADIVRMLTEMRQKSWTVVAADREIENVLALHGADPNGPTSTTTSDRTNPHETPVPSGSSRASGGPAPGRQLETPPPGWYADPAHRHQWRWFDQDWTPWASDHGTVVDDPF